MGGKLSLQCSRKRLSSGHKKVHHSANGRFDLFTSGHHSINPLTEAISTVYCRGSAKDSHFISSCAGHIIRAKCFVFF